MKPDPKIRATPRNIRVAYVLENGIDSLNWLDAIISDCFSRDGGRQSLVIPLINGTISSRYKGWLRLLDPDFVVLLTYDNGALAKDLITLLSDTQLLDNKRVRGEVEQHPRINIDCPLGLTSLSWLPFLKTVSGFVHSPPTHILDCYPAWQDDGLIKERWSRAFGQKFGFLK